VTVRFTTTAPAVVSIYVVNDADDTDEQELTFDESCDPKAGLPIFDLRPASFYTFECVLRTPGPSRFLSLVRTREGLSFQTPPE
jgi:hypothetical protein